MAKVPNAPADPLLTKKKKEREMDLLDQMPTKELARLTGVTERTVRNWISRRTKAPEAVYRLILLKNKNLAGLHEDWRDWTIDRNGQLWSPEGWRTSPGRVRGGEYLMCCGWLEKQSARLTPPPDALRAVGFD